MAKSRVAGWHTGHACGGLRGGYGAKAKDQSLNQGRGAGSDAGWMQTQRLQRAARSQSQDYARARPPDGPARAQRGEREERDGGQKESWVLSKRLETAEKKRVETRLPNVWRCLGHAS